MDASWLRIQTRFASFLFQVFKSSDYLVQDPGPCGSRTPQSQGIHIYAHFDVAPRPITLAQIETQKARKCLFFGPLSYGPIGALNVDLLAIIKVIWLNKKGKQAKGTDPGSTNFTNLDALVCDIIFKSHKVLQTINNLKKEVWSLLQTFLVLHQWTKCYTDGNSVRQMEKMLHRWKQC